MGSPISPIVANLFIEDFETKAINAAQYPPRIWKKYVDDTCFVIDSARKEECLEHINKIETHNQFTTEDAKADGSISFLDTTVMPQPDNSSSHQYTESPHIQTCTCTGTVTIICLQSSV